MKNILSISEVVHLAESAAVEAFNEVKTNGGTDLDAVTAGGVAFRVNLPTLNSLGAVQAYLAAIVRGLEMQWLTGREARVMIAAVRAWLTAREAAAAAKAVAL